MSEEKNRFKVGDRVKVNNLTNGIGTIIAISDRLGSDLKNTVEFDYPMYFTCSYGDNELSSLVNDYISKDKIVNLIENNNQDIDYSVHDLIDDLRKLLEENNNDRH